MSIVSLCNENSLGIHVTDMGMEDEDEEYRSPLFEKYGMEVTEEEVEEHKLLEKVDGETSTKDRKQLWLIYSLHLAEAYVFKNSTHYVSDVNIRIGLSRRACSPSYTCSCVIVSFVGASTLLTGLALLRPYSPLDQSLVGLSRRYQDTIKKLIK